ncbi:hypothetical protein E2C01_054895 [Portunus trituberculatus]|uniref:Uncharacterized protein n=1 Tax=Portunus trituberculatus TaxID=210409 RepID=A0A5B7GTE1_PORTR|nr:hypothetical protein [Portunus trituberculatus]
MYASLPDTITSVMRSAQRWVSDTDHSKENQHNTSSGTPTGRGKTPEALPLTGNLRRDWRNRTRYRNEIVIGGAQRR